MFGAEVIVIGGLCLTHLSSFYITSQTNERWLTSWHLGAKHIRKPRPHMGCFSVFLGKFMVVSNLDLM